MSSCSAAEIAEKKRIALAKLQAKQAQLGTSSKACSGIAGNGRSPLPTKQAQSFYKSPAPPVAGRPSIPPKVTENKSSSFLNAMKAITGTASRELARASAHPYSRDKPIMEITPENKPIASIFVTIITCRVYMISADRFAVQPSSYHEQLINVFKKIPSKAYDTGTRIWSFALEDYQLVQKHVGDLKPNVVIGTLPKKVIELCHLPATQMHRSCLTSIEPTLAEQLMPFQEDGVCFAIAQQGRIMICDEMGLGKTFQALGIADYFKDDWPLLICTTASTRNAWYDHIIKLLPSVPMMYTEILANNQQYIGDSKVLITSYSMMDRHSDKLLDRRFGVVIFDESHTLKNGKAKCTTVAKRLADQARRVVLLSGTPALSRPLELFTQLQLIDNRFMSFKDFTTRYCDGKQSNFGWDANGQSNLEELKVILLKKYMLRRTKAEVLPQLASKNRETVVLDPALVWTNDETKTSLNAFSEELSKSKGREREEILLRFYARTAEVKIRAVCAYLKSLVKEKIKFIIFAHHRVMMDAINDCLTQLQVQHIRIDGQTRSDLRAQLIDSFQNKSNCQVAVLSLKACNSGITLTAAEMIVFAELDWNPSTLAQAESRAHRIGQTKPIVCRYLMANKTADDVIWNMLKSKQDVLNKVGIFCENLQQATHTSAPTTSNKIEKYFSPAKCKSGPIDKYFSPAKKLAETNNNSPSAKDNFEQEKSKNINDEIADFFNDDDDEDFKDLVF